MKIVIGFLLIACITAFGIFFATPSTIGQKEQSDEATVVKRGQVTEKEREYSKEYKKLYSFRKSRKFSEIIEESEILGKQRRYLEVMWEYLEVFSCLMRQS